MERRQEETEKESKSPTERVNDVGLESSQTSAAVGTSTVGGGTGEKKTTTKSKAVSKQSTGYLSKGSKNLHFKRQARAGAFPACNSHPASSPGAVAATTTKKAGLSRNSDSDLQAKRQYFGEQAGARKESFDIEEDSTSGGKPKTGFRGLSKNPPPKGKGQTGRGENRKIQKDSELKLAAVASEAHSNLPQPRHSGPPGTSVQDEADLSRNSPSYPLSSAELTNPRLTRPSNDFNNNPSLLDQNLVEAKPVDEEDYSSEAIARADQVDEETLRQKEVKKQKERQCRMIGFALLAISIVIVIVALVVYFTTNNNSNASTEAASPTPLPTTSAPSASPTAILDDLFHSLLPSTRNDILNTTTPQWRAYDWLEYHPDLAEMTLARQTQLFALATFAYSMGYDYWPTKIKERWLDYGDECLWFSSNYGLFDENGTYYKDLIFDEESPCNDDKELKGLILGNLNLHNKTVQVPKEIALLTSLTHFAVGISGIKATMKDFLPEEIYNMQLLNFILSENAIRGDLSSELGLMTQLTLLYLDNNFITGKLPSELGYLTDMVELELENNLLSGHIISEISLMSNLKYLSLNDNQLTGSFKGLSLMHNLSYLGLSLNQLKGSIADTSFSEMSSLQILSLHNNELTGVIPTAQLSLLTNLTELVLWSNQLTGSLSCQELGTMTALTYYDVERNKLSGSICTEIGLLSNMKSLWLSHNQFSGSIPSAEIALMSSLMQLHLNNNPFITGKIPSELSQLSILGTLNLADLPLLSGTIPELPSSIGRLNISSSNGLTGEIPDALCHLQQNTSCIYLDFFENDWLECSLQFDCTNLLCGCDCSCSAS